MSCYNRCGECAFGRKRAFWYACSVWRRIVKFEEDTARCIAFKRKLKPEWKGEKP
jgi:hypothetical protein